MRSVRYLILFAVLLVGAELAQAQDRPASPRGKAATQIGDSWIEVDYGRPILRGRTNFFASGGSYGEQAKAGAPIWRVGANKSTRLMTQTALKFGDHTLPAGEYSLFVDLKGPDSWTLVVSNHQAKDNPQAAGDGIWGAYGYSQDMDVLRVPMAVKQTDMSMDELTIGFADVTNQGGKLVVWWEKTMATVPFMVAN